MFKVRKLECVLAAPSSVKRPFAQITVFRKNSRALNRGAQVMETPSQLPAPQPKATLTQGAHRQSGSDHRKREKNDLWRRKKSLDYRIKQFSLRGLCLLAQFTKRVPHESIKEHL